MKKILTTLAILSSFVYFGCPAQVTEKTCTEWYCSSAGGSTGTRVACDAQAVPGHWITQDGKSTKILSGTKLDCAQ